MRTFLVVFSLAVSVLAMTVRKPNVVAGALYPRQSTGTCVFGTCPATDELGDDLSPGASAITGTTLTCGYDTGIQCLYDTTTGDNLGPDPNCNPNSSAGGCARRRAAYKREDNYTAMLRRAYARNEEQRAR